MASEVGICNRALQKLGAKNIVSLGQDAPNAKTMNLAYEARRDALLQSHRWNFAIDREQLSADATAPEFGRANAFELPVTCLRVIPPYPEENFNDRDWIIEGNKIYTNESAPLNVRFIRKVTDPNEMTPLFRETLAADLAYETCEQITQSNIKKADCKSDLKDKINEAKKTNAIESLPQEPPADTWLTARA